MVYAIRKIYDSGKAKTMSVHHTQRDADRELRQDIDCTRNYVLRNFRFTVVSRPDRYWQATSMDPVRFRVGELEGNAL
jgi:hypothetical protein